MHLGGLSSYALAIGLKDCGVFLPAYLINMAVIVHAHATIHVHGHADAAPAALLEDAVHTQASK